MNINLYGLITGVLFGILLQRSRVIRYDKQIGALLFKDMTIVKFMLSTVMVGMVGIYLLKDLGIAKFSIKPMIVGAVVLGGFIFGIGWGLLGYCPGTSLGALGEGRYDALCGILGMILGAGIFAELYPLIKKTLLKIGDFGKVTLPEVTHINHWIIIPALIILGLLLFSWLENKRL